MLATRNSKAAELNPEQRAKGRKTLAIGLGFNARALVEGALARSDRAETMWTQALRGGRGAGARGLAIAARMGLTPRDGDRMDLLRTVLERGGPITVADVEARIIVLEAKRLLVAGDTRLLTTEMARHAETRVLAMMRDGRGKVEPLVPSEMATASIDDSQRTARLASGFVASLQEPRTPYISPKRVAEALGIQLSRLAATVIFWL